MRRVAEQQQHSRVVIARPICSQFGAVTRITGEYTPGLRARAATQIRHGSRGEDPVRGARARARINSAALRQDVQQRKQCRTGTGSHPGSKEPEGVHSRTGDSGNNRVTRSSACADQLWTGLDSDGRRALQQLALLEPPVLGHPVATEQEDETGDQREMKEDGPVAGQSTPPEDHTVVPLAKEEGSESSHDDDDFDPDANIQLLSPMHDEESRDHPQLSSILRKSKDARFREKLKAAEAVMEAALNRYVKQLQEKRMPGSDLDHDYVRQDEKPTDAGNARNEKKKAGNEGGSGRSSRAGSAPPSPIRDDSAKQTDSGSSCATTI
jgi:hypothetical protein